MDNYLPKSYLMVFYKNHLRFPINSEEYADFLRSVDDDEYLKMLESLPFYIEPDTSGNGVKLCSNGFDRDRHDGPYKYNPLDLSMLEALFNNGDAILDKASITGSLTYLFSHNDIALRNGRKMIQRSNIRGSLEY